MLEGFGASGLGFRNLVLRLRVREAEGLGVQCTEQHCASS